MKCECCGLKVGERGTYFSYDDYQFECPKYYLAEAVGMHLVDRDGGPLKIVLCSLCGIDLVDNKSGYCMHGSPDADDNPW